MDPDIILDPAGDLIIASRASPFAFAPWKDPGANEPDLQDHQPGAPVTERNSEQKDDGGQKDGKPAAKVQRIKISSWHLILASKHFKGILTKDWFDSPGTYHYGVRVLEYDQNTDLHAFAIVLSLIHNRYSQVPNSVDLDTLAKIAVIVDHLQCHEAVGVYPQLLIEKLWKGGISYNRDLILWIFIAQVFHDVGILGRVTRTAIYKCPGAFKTLGLQIRWCIIGEINKRREEILRKIFDVLHEFQNRLLRGDTECNLTCESMLYGSLVKQLPLHYFTPPPSHPYTSYTIAQVLVDVRALKKPQWGSKVVQAISPAPNTGNTNPQPSNNPNQPTFSSFGATSSAHTPTPNKLVSSPFSSISSSSASGSKPRQTGSSGTGPFGTHSVSGSIKPNQLGSSNTGVGISPFVNSQMKTEARPNQTQGGSMPNAKNPGTALLCFEEHRCGFETLIQGVKCLTDSVEGIHLEKDLGYVKYG
ncbi:hypothetical protein HD806DRAFT_523258 [Xylariaceae sp. AK1471]|nr:hypothetical protein HD806DRAFT_523258 [Xylariaceae sp. AK1471]